MADASSYFLTWQAVALVATVAVIGPTLSRLFSPVVLLLLSPLFAVLLLLAYIAANVLIPHALDTRRRLRASSGAYNKHFGQAAKQFSFSTPAAWQAVLTRSQWSFTSPHTLPPLIPTSPSVSASLNDILVLIVRDFVLSWYTRSISPSPAFPNAVSHTLRHAVRALLTRAENVDLASLVVHRVLPKINAHIDTFCESEKALRGVGLERRLTQSDELDLLLASRYATRGGKRLHPAVDNLSTMLTKPTEEVYLRALVEKILPLILPPEEAGSRAVHVMAREIVTVSVLAPLLEMFGDPDFWNRMIDQFAGAAIHEQKLVHKVRHLLDTQSTTKSGAPWRPLRAAGLSLASHSTSAAGAGRSLHGPSENTTITSRTGARQFESFLKSITKCDSLLDARRLRNDIVAEIRRTREVIVSHPNEATINGERVENLEAFLDRLNTAKRRVDKRITMLGGADNSAQSLIHGRTSSTGFGSNAPSLRDVLSSPNSISYLMEFMDRRHRSLLVQFWLTVETFKDPLESLDNATANPEAQSRVLPSNDEDIKLIYDLYFAGQGSAPTPVLRAVSERHVDVIRSYVTHVFNTESSGASPTIPSTAKSTGLGSDPSQRSIRVRQAVLLAQKQVEDAMVDDFEDFKRSELWFRVYNELVRANRGTTTPDLQSEGPSSPISPIDPHATPTRRPLMHSVTAPTTSATPRPRTQSTGNNRNFDTVRSRIYPTFILPSTSESPITATTTDLTGTDAAVSITSRRRLRHTSFGSDAGSTFSTATSPLMSNSLDSLPPLSPPPISPPPPQPQVYHSALDFLTSTPEPAPSIATAAGSTSTRAPLFDDPEIIAEETAHAERMEAIQAALTDLIADQHNEGGGGGGGLFPEEDAAEREAGASSHSSPMGRHRELLFPSDLNVPGPGSPVSGRTPSFSTARSVSDPFSRPHGEGDTDEHGDGPSGSRQRTNLLVAAPGDLLLSQDISRLGEKISKLQSQEVLLEALTRKAELTGDVNELRLLSRSKASLAKEVREMSFQKTQYEQQEQENKLVPGRTKITVPSTSATESEGKQVVRYLVEIEQLGVDDKVLSSWTVMRRYSEFFAVHQRLKERYASVKSLDFPGKRLVTSLSNSFMDMRRVSLERWLQNLIMIPLVCESEELRGFLSRQVTLNESGAQIAARSPILFPGQEIVRTMYRSVAESIDDMFFGPSMLDIMIQRLSRQAAEFAGIVGSGVNDEDLVANAVKSPDETLMQMPGDLKTLGGESSTSTFTAPICDLVLSVFELDQKKNWLRRQAVLVILQQVLGGTIERKLREAIKSLTDDSHAFRYLQSFRDTMWPGGQWRATSEVRTASMKADTRDEANKKLSALIPDLAGNMIGGSNAKRGARRIFAVLQNRRLNQHIVYTVMDEIFEALFPETISGGSPPRK